MILELRFNDYKMFKGENVLSLSADTRIKRLGSNYVDVLNRNVLKSLSLYGQNNIGKSNVLVLFRFLKSLFLGKENIPFNKEVFDDGPLSDFSITFKTGVDENWMKYSCTYDSFKDEITKESLCEITYYETAPHWLRPSI